MSRRKTWLVTELDSDQVWKTEYGSFVDYFISRLDAERAANSHTSATGKTALVYEAVCGYEKAEPNKFIPIDISKVEGG